MKKQSYSHHTLPSPSCRAVARPAGCAAREGLDGGAPGAGEVYTGRLTSKKPDTFSTRLLRRALLSACLLVAALCIGVAPAQAVTYYWVGSAGGNTNSSTNWASSDPASCTGGGAGTPTSTDSIIFDPDCDNNATINANLAATSITIQSGYSGTITQNASITVTVGASGWTQAGGTFAGGNSAIDINGAFSMTGGTFTSTSGSLTVERGLSITGGTFNHNSGTVTLDGAYLGDSSFDASGVSFNVVTINRTVSGSTNRTLTIAANTTIPLGSSPSVTLNNTSAGASTGIYFLQNNGTITSSSTGAITLSIESFTNAGTFSANSATQLTLNGDITNNGTFSLSAATTFDLNSYPSASDAKGGGFTNGASGVVTTGSNPTFTVNGDFVVPNTSTFPSNVSLTLDGAYLGDTQVNAPGVSFSVVSINRSASGSTNRTLTIASGTTIPLGSSPSVALSNSSGGPPQVSIFCRTTAR